MFSVYGCDIGRTNVPVLIELHNIGQGPLVGSVHSVDGVILSSYISHPDDGVGFIICYTGQPGKFKRISDRNSTTYQGVVFLVVSSGPVSLPTAQIKQFFLGLGFSQSPSTSLGTQDLLA